MRFFQFVDTPVESTTARTDVTPESTSKLISKIEVPSFRIVHVFGSNITGAVSGLKRLVEDWHHPKNRPIEDLIGCVGG